MGFSACWKLSKMCSEVKWSVVQWKGVNRGVPWRVFSGCQMKWSEGYVKISVQ